MFIMLRETYDIDENLFGVREKFVLCKESLGFFNVKENVRYFEWKVGGQKDFRIESTKWRIKQILASLSIRYTYSL